MTYGLTENGLVIKPSSAILARLIEAQRATVSDQIDGASTDTLVGQFNHIVADEIASLWEALEDIWQSRNPSMASGFSLRELCGITATVPVSPTDPASFSRAACDVVVDPGTYPAGSLVAIVDGRPDIRFANLTQVENSGPSSGAFSVVFQSEVSGAVAAPAGSLVIGDSVPGWTSVLNAADASLGRPPETDGELRLRRERELAAGSTTADALRSAILRALSASGVISVRVLVNDTNATVDGVPPHAVEPIVYGPASPTTEDDAALAAVIAASKADGIQSHGSESVVVTDAQGNEIEIGFTRPTPVNAYAEFDLLVDSNYAGDDAVKNAIVSMEQSLQPGQSASYYQTARRVLGVAGVVDIVTGGIGTSPSVSETPIAVTARQIVDFDTARINVSTSLV